MTQGYDAVSDPVGDSNADYPALVPVLYNPTAAQGSRFSSKGMPTANLARMYHSSASLMPSGAVMVAGSNPHGEVTVGKKQQYPTQYNVEEIRPGYMAAGVVRPAVTTPAGFSIGWNATVSVNVNLPQNYTNMQGAFHDAFCPFRALTASK